MPELWSFTFSKLLFTIPEMCTDKIAFFQLIMKLRAIGLIFGPCTFFVKIAKKLCKKRLEKVIGFHFFGHSSLNFGPSAGFQFSDEREFDSLSSES